VKYNGRILGYTPTHKAMLELDYIVMTSSAWSFSKVEKLKTRYRSVEFAGTHFPSLVLLLLAICCLLGLCVCFSLACATVCILAMTLVIGLRCSFFKPLHSVIFKLFLFRRLTATLCVRSAPAPFCCVSEYRIQARHGSFPIPFPPQ